MKIPGTTRSAPIDPVRRVGSAPQKEGRRQASSEPAARVELSPQARKLLEARSKKGELVDDARVARLRGEVRAGTYRIDYDRIAERMLQEEV